MSYHMLSLPVTPTGAFEAAAAASIALVRASGSSETQVQAVAGPTKKLTAILNWEALSKHDQLMVITS